MPPVLWVLWVPWMRWGPWVRDGAVFKAAAAGLRDAPGDAARRKRLFDVMTDGLRPRVPPSG